MTDDLAGSLRFLVDLLEQQEIPYMVVGSVAALAHGRARSTQDVDVVVDLTLAKVERFIAAFPEDRFYVSEEAARDAIRRQTLFNVIDLSTGWKIDLVPRKRRGFSEEELRRRVRIEVLGLPLWVASLEDTIVAKLEWAELGGGSARQREDIRELVQLGGDQLDRAYVERWAEELGLIEAWTRLVEN